MKPAVVLGDANVDLTIRLPDRTGAGADLSRSEPALGGGGTAANTAAALARLGLEVEFVGSIGDDGFGRWVTNDFEALGVGRRGLVRLTDAFTPVVIAMLQPDGERHLVVWPPRGGAHTRLRPGDLNPELINSAGWLHTTGMCLRDSPVRDAVLHGMRLARAAGLPVSLDLNLRIELWGLPAGVREAVAQAVALADVVFGSAADEIGPLAGGGLPLAEAMQALSGGIRTIVARSGASGAAAWDGTALLSAPALPVTVQNLVGAGDIFNAGFIAARMEGQNVQEALRWGNAAAAYKIQRGGRELPTGTELRSLLARHRS